MALATEIVRRLILTVTQFYGGVFNTYLSLHFSTESRALSSFITREPLWASSAHVEQRLTSKQPWVPSSS